MKLREVTPKQLEDFREMVETDFPGDSMMQEVHLARLILEEEMRDLTPDERIELLSQSRSRRAA